MLYSSLGLADDSFIVEAPSFVVPYLIEKTAAEDLKKAVELLSPPKKEEESAEVSEDEASDSEKKEKEKEESKPTTAPVGSTDKSSMKNEMEKSTEKPSEKPSEKPAAKSEVNKEDEDYFTGPIGRFFLDIGLSLVQEYVQGDLLRAQKRKVHKGTKITDPSLSVNALSKGIQFESFVMRIELELPAF